MDNGPAQRCTIRVANWVARALWLETSLDQEQFLLYLFWMIRLRPAKWYSIHASPKLLVRLSTSSPIKYKRLVHPHEFLLDVPYTCNVKYLPSSRQAVAVLALNSSPRFQWQQNHHTATPVSWPMAKSLRLWLLARYRTTCLWRKTSKPAFHQDIPVIQWLFLWHLCTGSCVAFRAKLIKGWHHYFNPSSQPVGEESPDNSYIGFCQDSEAPFYRAGPS